MNRPWQEQVVVLTGAGTGLGRQLALALARQKCRLAIADADDAALAETEHLARQQGAQVEAVVTDPSDWNQVQILASRTLERFGGLDAWIHNAAATVPGEFEQVPWDAFRRVVEVNLMGHAHGLKAAIAAMRETGGVIVSITPRVGDHDVPWQSAYCASASAIRGLTQSVRAEISRHQWPIALCLIEDPDNASKAVLRCLASPPKDALAAQHQKSLVAWPSPPATLAWGALAGLAFGWWLSRRSAA